MNAPRAKSIVLPYSGSESILASNRVLRNTYMLLSMPLLLAVATAGTSTALQLPHPGILMTLVGYFGLPNGGQTVMLAMGGTAAIFLGLSAYALASKRDFSFMGGFLAAGILLAFLAGLAAIFFEIPALSLTVSAAFVLLMSGFILYETGNIVHGGGANYVLVTVSLFVSIFNLFSSLLHLPGVSGSHE